MSYLLAFSFIYLFITHNFLRLEIHILVIYIASEYIMTFVIATFVFSNNGKKSSPIWTRDGAKNTIFIITVIFMLQADFVVLN